MLQDKFLGVLNNKISDGWLPWSDTCGIVAMDINFTVFLITSVLLLGVSLVVNEWVGVTQCGGWSLEQHHY